MLEFLMAGGWVMWPILILSLLAMAIILERFWTLRATSVLPPGLGWEVCQWAAKGKLDPAHVEALRDNSALGALLAATLDVRHWPRHQIKERVEDVGRHLSHRMERFLNTLGTIAAVSPLLGLLGTVFGMIRMFMSMLEFGVGDPNRLAGGIGEALVSTAAGLSVAIPALIFYRYFRGRVAEYVVEMEKQAIALLDTLEHASPAVPSGAVRSEASDDPLEQAQG